jgi:uncharacterized repeat protein (TIGR03803 family)
LVLFAAVMIFVSAEVFRASAQTFTTLHTFTVEPDGENPFGGLVADGKGNYYGTTEHGGTHSYGTVFELSPPAAGSSRWTETVIWNFAGGTDGTTPSFQLVMDAKGNLYGEAQAGGNETCGCGNVFVLVPPKSSGGNWSKRILYVATGRGGADLYGGLILDSTGALYGIEPYGGDSIQGLAFKIAPAAGGGYTTTTLYNFGATTTDSEQPFGPLTLDSSGSLYGVSTFGGASNLGTVYKLSPPTGGGTWTNTILYSFPGTNAGCYPQGNLILDTTGKLYGQATGCGGTANMGVIFRLTPAGSGPWTESVLHTFSSTDGGGVYPSLSLDGKTNVFYGTSFSGGVSGVVFQLKPPESGSGIWIETVLHTFLGASDGNAPLGPIVWDANGVLYGTAYYGADGDGTAFSIKP